MKSINRTIGFSLLFLCFPGGEMQAQTPELIRLRNPSFEAPSKYFFIPPSWSPQILFLGARKVKELRLTRFYRAEEGSQKGNNHVALATYKDGVRENVGQRLRYPVIPGHTYTLDLWLAWSPLRTTIHPIQHLSLPEKDLQPIKLQVYGFYSDSDLANRLLAETSVVDHREWKKYTLEWTSTGKYQYLYLVASWYGEEYYDGNILMDNLSPIRVAITPTAK